MKDRRIQLFENIEFFCKLANLQDWNYDVSSFQKIVDNFNGGIFPCIGYLESIVMKYKFAGKYSKLLMEEK